MRTPENLALCFALALGCLGPVVAQQHVQKSFLAPAIGLSVVGEDIHDGRRYHARLFTFQQGFNLSRPIRTQWPLYLKMEAHFALNNIQTAGNRDFEIAGASGLELHYLFDDGWRIATALVGGPAFISAKNAKQRRGFLFTANMTLAVFIPLGDKGLFLKPEIRYRHMSNASLFSPNVGLDNIFVMVGVGTQHFFKNP